MRVSYRFVLLLSAHSSTVTFYQVDKLELPANPLDRLLNELGGPDKVAELTSRKTRQVQRYDIHEDKMKVVYEKRKGEG